jgi:hypothetical protein
MCDHGAMLQLLNDGARVKISEHVLGLLCSSCVADWQSEPNEQHQNPVERRYQTLKTMTNTTLHLAAMFDVLVCSAQPHMQLDNSGSPTSTLHWINIGHKSPAEFLLLGARMLQSRGFSIPFY